MLALLLAAAGCRGSEEQRLEELRARYRVEVAGFVVEQRPLAPAPATPAVPDSAAPGVSEPAPIAAPGAPALVQDVRVDLLVHRQLAAGEAAGGKDEGAGPLRLPVELTLTGPGGAVRGSWPAVLEAAGPAVGGKPVRASYFLKEVPFQPGDRFTVAITSTGAGKAGEPSGAGEDAGRP